MFSEISTGTCRRPSCTAMMSPTICGITVEARDQVLIVVRWPLRTTASTFFSRWSATNGPFFVDRDILFAPVRGPGSEVQGPSTLTLDSGLRVPDSLLRPAAHDELVRALVVARAVAERRLAPRRLRTGQ